MPRYRASSRFIGVRRIPPSLPFADVLLAGSATHAWDFITNRSRFSGKDRGPLSATPNWTFTRASTGYAQTSGGVLVPFASGELRRTDKGVLREGAGTNLCLQSQTFDNASWTKDRASISANAIYAPDGTLTADTLIEDSTATNTHQARQSFTFTNVVHTFSVFLKAGTRTWAQVVLFDGTTVWGTYVNLATGALGTISGSAVATVQALANGWYRVSVTSNAATAAAAGNCQVRLATGDGAASYSGDGTSGLYLWGAQLEATAYASSYVPTTTGSATRAADSLTVTGVSGLDYPLTLYAEFERGVDTGGNEVLFSVDAGDSSNSAALRVNSSDLAQISVTTGGASQATPSVAGAIALGAVSKAAVRIATNSVQIAKGGALGTEDTSSTNPSAPANIRFGALGAGSNPPYSYLRRLAIFSRALSDGELQALTAA